MIHPRWAALLLAAWLAPAQPQALPQWLVDAQARELPLPPTTTVASDDGWLQARLPGKVSHKVVLEDGTYSLNIELGPDVTMSCEVVRGARDLAEFLKATAQVSFDMLQKAHGGIEARAVEATDAGATGGFPYLALRWLFRTSGGNEARVGGLKQFAADLGEAVVYCAQDELGYVKTFAAVAQALAAQLRIEGRPVDPGEFREISVVEVSGQRVGVATTTMRRDADGDTQVFNKAAMLLPRTPSVLLSQDTIEIQWVRPDGSLINAAQVKSSDGELTENMRLQPGEGTRWQAEGTLAGKPVSFELPAAPSSFIAQALARRQLMARPDPVGASTEAPTWSSLDLSRLLPSRATVRASAGADGFAVREEIGSLAFEAVLDRSTGTVSRATIPVGPVTLNFTRVFRHGSFR